MTICCARLAGWLDAILHHLLGSKYTIVWCPDVLQDGRHIDERTVDTSSAATAADLQPTVGLVAPLLDGAGLDTLQVGMCGHSVFMVICKDCPTCSKM